MGAHRYLISLGSNIRHARYGQPRKVIAAALQQFDGGEFALVSASPIIETAPLGPSRRRYANAVAVVGSDHGPVDALSALQGIERDFGRTRIGQPWRARVLDIDIVMWNGGAWASDGDEGSVVIPHPAFRSRAFVLGPAASIAGSWRDPLSGLTINHLTARLTKPRPAPR